MFKVWCNLVGLFCDKIPYLDGLEWKEARPKTLGSGDVNKDSAVVAEDVHVERFIAFSSDALKNIWVNKNVVNDLMSPLVRSEISKAMSVQDGVVQATFTVQLGETPCVCDNYFVQTSS